jgi:tRNA1(Val) A37 N6-methylase TrmN6
VLTSERFESCGLTIAQPRKGHRYGPESLCLAAFAEVRPGDRIVDLGAGVGVIALLLAARREDARVTAVEIQPALHAIAEHNVVRNGYGGRVQCVCDDARRFAEQHGAAFDLVVANPPFYRRGAGRLCADAQRAAARHELHGTIADVCAAASMLMAPGARFALVFEASRREDLETAAAQAGLCLSRQDVQAGRPYLLAEYRKVR